MIEPVNIPETAAGPWKVSRFTVSELASALDAIRARGRYVPPGTYTRLTRGHVVVMSDTPAERRDHYEPVRRARGHVLINGLGIGMVLKAVLAKQEVSRVTVVEVSQELIDLIAPHYKDPRLTIVCADAYEYQPPKGERYGAVWHDIWDYITPDNLAGMTKLKRKYGRRTDWQGCWAESLCRYYKKRGR